MRNLLLILSLILFGVGLTNAQVNLVKSGKKQATTLPADNLKAEVQKHCPLNIKSASGEEFTLSADGKSSGPASSKGNWMMDGSQLVVQNKTEGKEFRFPVELKNKSLHIEDHLVKKEGPVWSVEIIN